MELKTSANKILGVTLASFAPARPLKKDAKMFQHSRINLSFTVPPDSRQLLYHRSLTSFVKLRGFRPFSSFKTDFSTVLNLYQRNTTFKMTHKTLDVPKKFLLLMEHRETIFNITVSVHSSYIFSISTCSLPNSKKKFII